MINLNFIPQELVYTHFLIEKGLFVSLDEDERFLAARSLYNTKMEDVLMQKISFCLKQNMRSHKIIFWGFFLSDYRKKVL